MSKLVSFDFAIKFLLKDKGNYSIIEGFISALLKEQGYKPVKIIALLDTESNREEYSSKKSLADLVVEDEEHHKYIIEIERQEAKNFVHKACFNTSRLIVDQISAGIDYTEIKKVFHISLLYFNIGDGPIYHGKTIVREVETKEKLSIHIEDKNKKVVDATEIFPEYIFISIPQFDDKVKREIDEWLYVMKYEEVKEEFKSPYMREVASRLDILKMTTDARNEYYKYMKDVTTYKDTLKTAEEKGIEKGIKKGIEKVAKNLLDQGLDIEIIAKSTRLTIEDLTKIKNS